MVEAYDPITDKWSRKANLPISGECWNAVVDGKIYVMGWGVFVGAEFHVRPDVYEYNPKLDNWLRKTDIPTNRTAISAIAVDGKIYAVGGVSGFNPYRRISTVEIYDPKTDTWEKGIDLPDARGYLTGDTVDGKIYVIGGVDAWPNPNSFPDLVLPTVEAFDTGFLVSSQDKLPTTWGETKSH